MQKLLGDYRRDAGFGTQKKLAETIGVGRNVISRWETGERSPRLPMIPKLAQTLGVTEGEIIAAIAAARRDESAYYNGKGGEANARSS